MWHVCEIGQAHAGFWWGNRRERGHLGEPAVVDGRMILKCNIKK